MADNSFNNKAMLNDLVNRLRGGFSCFWVETGETLRAVKEISDALVSYSKEPSKLYVPYIWNLETAEEGISDIFKRHDSMAEGTVLILVNFHWMLKDSITGAPNATLVQMIQNRAEKMGASTQRKAIIAVTSISAMDIPSEISSLFSVLNFALPDGDSIKASLSVIEETAKKNPKYIDLSEEDRERVISAMRGLTQRDGENSLSYSLVKTGGKIDHNMVNDIKAKVVESAAGLNYSRFAETFDSLKGYSALKEFTSGTIKSKLAKGVILLGPPGTGKSHFCKALGNESGLPVLEFEMGSVFGSLVGESEQKMRKVIEIVKAMAPCILFIDEIEKGLAGTRGGTNDGGTTVRTMGQFLKFLSDRPEGIYVVATCNDIQAIPPEYLRAERWDTAPFFVDLPTEEERESILNYYKKVFEVEGDIQAHDTEGWSGAEIKSLCRIAAMMGKRLEDTKDFIVPISKTMEGPINELRRWAVGKTLMANSAKRVLESDVKITEVRDERTLDFG